MIAFLDSDHKAVNGGGTRQYTRLGGVKIIENEDSGKPHPSAGELNDTIAASMNRVRCGCRNRRTGDRSCRQRAPEKNSATGPSPSHRTLLHLRAGFVAAPAAAAVIAMVTQPSFIYYNSSSYLQTSNGEIGWRLLYPIRSMLEHGLCLRAGSRFSNCGPESVHRHPWGSDAASGERRRFFPQQRIGVLDAIRMHTVGAAAADFRRGSRERPANWPTLLS